MDEKFKNTEDGQSPVNSENATPARTAEFCGGESLRGRFIAWLKHKFHRCSESGCWKKGHDCYLPDYGDGEEEPPIEWVCIDHMHDAGFCWSCRQFHAGIEDFEFRSNGLCFDCDLEVRAEYGEFDECEYDGDPDAYYDTL